MFTVGLADRDDLGRRSAARAARRKMARMRAMSSPTLKGLVT